jgi:hypothetical protein
MPLTSSLYQPAMPGDLVRPCQTAFTPAAFAADVFSHHDDPVSLILPPFDGISRTSRTDASFSEAIHTSICGRHSPSLYRLWSNVSTSRTPQPACGETEAENAVEAARWIAAIAYPLQGATR